MPTMPRRAPRKRSQGRLPSTGTTATASGTGSGRATRTGRSVDIAAGFLPGRALDLGAGEGADSIWLAEQGWWVTAVDISSTALDRAAAAASGRPSIHGRIDWLATDLAQWQPEGRYDLVSSFFLHSPVDFPRTAVLRRAAGAVVPGGHFLLVGHAQPPPWAAEHHEHAMSMRGPDDELAEMALDVREWETLIAGGQGATGHRPGR